MGWSMIAIVCLCMLVNFSCVFYFGSKQIILLYKKYKERLLYKYKLGKYRPKPPEPELISLEDIARVTNPTPVPAKTKRNFIHIPSNMIHAHAKLLRKEALSHIPE